MTELLTCDGTETMVVNSVGLSAYVGDEHYAAVSFSFTPTGGGATETKTFGQRRGLSGAVSSSTKFAEGVFTVDGVPVPPQGG